MKSRIFITALALSISGFANATSNEQLCINTSFKAFGEPEQTVRDCPDPDEMFWVEVTIDGLHYPPQGLGLVIPQSSSKNTDNASAFLTAQVMKQNETYRVRIQATKDGGTINWAGEMVPDTQKELTLNGKNVTIKFVRQQS